MPEPTFDQIFRELFPMPDKDPHTEYFADATPDEEKEIKSFILAKEANTASRKEALHFHQEVEQDIIRRNHTLWDAVRKRLGADWPVGNVWYKDGKYYRIPAASPPKEGE